MKTALLHSVCVSSLAVMMVPTLTISSATAETRASAAVNGVPDNGQVNGLHRVQSAVTLTSTSALNTPSPTGEITAANSKLAVVKQNVAVVQQRIKEAASVKTRTVAVAPAVTAMINDIPFPSISVGGDQTYVKWTALDAFHTPYANQGNAVFAITGGMISGVVYKGVAYLPWNQLAPDVKATKLKNGAWSFTAVPVRHDYQLFVDAMNAPAADPNNGINAPAPLLVAVLDGDNPVPNQTVDITLNGGGFFSNYQNKTQIQVNSSAMGYNVYGVNDKTQETIQPTVTWKDPLGKVLTVAKSITFTQPADAATPVIPSNASLVASVPVSIYQDQVLFNVTSTGYRELFQLDTGAQIPLINKQVANELHLPVIAKTTVEGVTGQDQAYDSQISFSIGGKTFTNVPCVVDPNYTSTSLIGYDFFVKNGYDILLSQSQGTLTLLAPSTNPTGAGSSTSSTSTSSLGNGPSTSGLTVTPGSTSGSSSSTGITVTGGSAANGSTSSSTSSPTAPVVASAPTTSAAAVSPPPAVTIPVPQKLWSGYEGNVGANPVIAGTVAVCADADSNGAIYAYDLATGNKVWEYDQGNFYNGILAGSPTTVLMTVGSNVLALSASSGQQMWSKSIGTVKDMQIIGNKAVIAAAYNVYVQDAVTGQTIFSVATPWPVAKVTGTSNGLLLGTSDGKVIGLSWTGQIQQQTQLATSLITGMTPDSNGGWIVTQGTTVTDLTSNGIEQWTKNFHISIEGGNVSVDGQYAALATSDDTLYLLNTVDGSVYASATMPLGASTYSPTASNGIIYEVNRMGSLSLFDEATLKQQQTESSGGTMGTLVCVASPLVSSGTVVVQTHQSGYSGDASLIAFN